MDHGCISLLQARALNFDPDYKNMKDPVQVRKSPINLHTLRCVPDVYRDSDVTKKFIEAIDSGVFIKGLHNLIKLSYVIVGPLKRKDHVSTGMRSGAYACTCMCWMYIVLYTVKKLLREGLRFYEGTVLLTVRPVLIEGEKTKFLQFEPPK